MHHDSLLFKNVDLLLPDGVKRGDLLVENGKIAAIGPDLPEHADHIVRDKGLLLMPGVIDPHVHFREPGADHKETLYSGSKAAISGGVTSFLDMPNTNPVTTTIETIDQRKHRASETSLANFGFFIGATPDNLSELQRVEQVPGIKVFMGSSTGSLLVKDRHKLEAIFQHTPHLIAVHAEDEDIIQDNRKKYENSEDVYDHCQIRSPEAAIKATKLAVQLAKTHNKRLHICHLTTKEEAHYLATAKIGTQVTTEVSPQHLLLFGRDMYARLGTKAKINPPLRDESHATALWDALKSGVIDFIATDHAPHTLEEKNTHWQSAHSGMPGVETALPLMLTRMNQGLCTLQDILKWMCEAPARVYRMQGKGSLKIGYDADLAIIDLNAKKTLTNQDQVTKVKWTAFDGAPIHGFPIATIVHGQIVFREGDFFEEHKGKAIVFAH